MAGKRTGAPWVIMNNMSKATLPSECDVVVIGAGIAGLTASALLAKSGLKVVLVEEQPRPGGYFACFKRKGYTFSSSIQWLNECNEGGLVNRIFSHIAPDFPVCKDMKHIRRYKGESFDYVLTREPDKLRDRLIQEYPDDEKGIIRFFDDCRKIGRHFGKLKGRMRAVETMSFLETAMFGFKMLLWTIPIWKYLRMTAEKGINGYFKNDDIKKIFCSEKKFMSIIMPICWAFTGDFQSPPEGGSGAFANWLCGKIEKFSSHVVLNCAVEKILMNDKRAAGVSLSGGHVISSKYIIAACDAENLYARMLPAGAVPDRMIRRLRKADLYYSSVTVFLGLDCDASVLGLHEGLTCITADNGARADHSGRDPDKISLLVQAPSVGNTSLAPHGKSTLTIHCAAWMDYENHWRTEKDFGRGSAYRELKKNYADVLIARVEKAMNVNIRKYIEVIEIATPVTYWRYSKNFNGSIMGARPTMKNIIHRVAHYHTPVKNIFLGGHWAEYGGGMPIAVKAASNASLLILKQLKKKEFAVLRDVMDRKR